MRLLLIGDCNSIHLIKWARALHAKNIEIGLFSLSNINHSHFENLDNLTIQSIQLSSTLFKSGEGSFKKISYLKALPRLKSFIKTFKPQILHAHYASSYGLLGALSNFHPYIVSVWGSDIYDFPKRNFIFKQITKHTLGKADQILSTSKVMAIETQQYTDKNIIETPFGVNLEKFKPIHSEKLEDGPLVVGTIKALEYKYGIDVLIDAFAEVKKMEDSGAIELHLVGEGQEKAVLEAQVKKLGLTKYVKFLGRIDNNVVPKVLNSFDVYAALSRWDSESFGVAIVEAQACEVPVVVSNTGGLPEVVSHNESGIVVESENKSEAAQAILQLIKDPNLRKAMGKAGRKRVSAFYDWNENVQKMVEVYTTILSKKDET